MSSPFLVDNILHQQKAANFHNQYINHQLENYVLQRQEYERSRENSPEMDEAKITEEHESRRRESIDESKIENDEDSKSRDEEEAFNLKNETVYYNNDYYARTEDVRNTEKEVLNIPTLTRRCQSCGAFDCPPYTCKKSGIRRLEELEKRFNLHNYQENSGDEADGCKDGKPYSTEDIVRSCEEYNEQKKPPLKFSVSAILGDRDDTIRNSSINGK
ncbi:unnamed protein product [Parnassius apollo]|uniref:(apollo) hypothetical protein n=1 Tax=Parnassius apollo TaxID=110799 RepID=A0A8S3WA36_PARAO|nr:unnamed protein product [Parnassius apollo]